MFKALATAFAVLSSITLLLSVSLHAMEIQKYDKMADKDQDEYVAELVLGVQKILRDEGRADLERTEKDPNAAPLEVEHAMIVVLKKNGINLPKSFMSMMKDFKPKHPSKEKK